MITPHERVKRMRRRVLLKLPVLQRFYRRCYRRPAVPWLRPFTGYDRIIIDRYAGAHMMFQTQTGQAKQRAAEIMGRRYIDVRTLLDGMQPYQYIQINEKDDEG